MIIQWGQVNTTINPGSTSNVLFPQPFPNACSSLSFNYVGYNGWDGHIIRTTIPSVSGFAFNWDQWSANGTGNSVVLMYTAIGY